LRRRTSTVSMVVLQGGLVHQDKHLLILGMVPCAHESIFDHTGVTDELMNLLSGLLHYDNRVGI